MMDRDFEVSGSVVPTARQIEGLHFEASFARPFGNEHSAAAVSYLISQGYAKSILFLLYKGRPSVTRP